MNPDPKENIQQEMDSSEPNVDEAFNRLIASLEGDIVTELDERTSVQDNCNTEVAPKGSEVN